MPRRRLMLSALALTLILPLLSVASDFSGGPANFALFIGNNTTENIQINGPAANGVAYGPAYNCHTLKPNDGISVNVGGPFRWTSLPPGTAAYAFSTGGKCGSDTNVISFGLENYQGNGPAPQYTGYPGGCYQDGWALRFSRWFNTVGVNTCLSWNEMIPSKYWLGIDNFTDPNSGLPAIKLTINRRQ